MPAELSELPRSAIPLRGRNIVGLEALQGFFSGTRESLPSLPPLVLPDLGLTDLKGLVDELATAEQRPCHGDGQGRRRQDHGCRRCRSWARLSRQVGPPDHHRPGTTSRRDPPRACSELTVSRIDPKEEVRLHRERMLVSAKATKSPEQLALLKEELQSPCYEEVTVFRAFSRAVISGRKAFMVIDTAPTGHTLLLLDTAGAYRLSCGPVIPSISGMIPLSPVVAAPDGGSTITTSLLPINAVMRNQDRLCCCGIKVV